MNIEGKKTFAILMVIAGCLISNSSLKLAAASINIDDLPERASFSAATSAISDGLVSLTVTTNSLITNALSNRMTNVKGCLADPFVYAVYGHNQSNVAAECGYKGNTHGGLVLGVDHVWTFADKRYFRLGAAMGYVLEGTTFFGTLSGTFSGVAYTHSFSKKSDINVYALRLFGAYESFNDKCLKTNIGVMLGYNHGKDQFISSESMSNDVLLGVEFTKNLYAYIGYQLGLWLQTNYGFILQTIVHNGSPQDISFDTKFIHDFLATVVGLNIEKEIFVHADRKLTLSLKAGWECRVIQRSIVTLDATLGADELYGIFRLKHPCKNAALLSFKASQKLNDHWSLAGSYTGRFNGDLATHNLAGGVEYSF
jgi:hypothetical protein